MSKYRQTTLDDEVAILMPSDIERLAKLLNSWPYKNIALVQRGIGVDTIYRPQIRFYSMDRITVNWVKGILKLSPMVKELKDGWQIQVTKSQDVKGLLRMVFDELNQEAQKRAMLLMQALHLLDFRPKGKWASGPQEKFFEIVEKLR